MNVSVMHWRTGTQKSKMSIDPTCRHFERPQKTERTAKQDTQRDHSQQYVCVCMCVCVSRDHSSMCVCVCVYVCLETTAVCVCVCVCMYVQGRDNSQQYVCVYVCVYMCVCVYVQGLTHRASTCWKVRYSLSPWNAYLPVIIYISGYTTRIFTSHHLYIRIYHTHVM